MLDFFLEFSHERVVGGADLVRADLRHDFLCSVRELQRRNRLFRVVDQRADGCDQGRARIASKTVLKEARDFRVAVGNVRLALALGEALDHLAQATQTQVDGLQLEEVLLPHDLLFVDFLTAGQIAQVQFAAHQHPFSVRLV